MKKILLFIVLATFFVACDKIFENPNGGLTKKQPDLTEIRIKDRPCEILEYVGKIGNDYDSALDSLRKLKTISSEIIKEPLEVLFDYDNRKFYGIAYGDCGMYANVLDTKGNYYVRSWYCPEEDDAKIQEESIFNENKTFKIIHGACGSIMYDSRFGNDFDSALDSLIKHNELFIGGREYYIEKEKMTIDFNYDNRDFYSISFIDKVQNFHIFSLSDVIDNNGNHFFILWCED